MATRIDANGAPPTDQLAKRDAILGLFDVYDRDTVIDYLDNHQDLIPVLAEARQEMPKYFPDTPLALSVSVDADDPTDRELFIYIYTTLPVEEAISRRNRFEENWYIDADRRTGQTFNVNLRFP